MVLDCLRSLGIRIYRFIGVPLELFFLGGSREFFGPAGLGDLCSGGLLCSLFLEFIELVLFVLSFYCAFYRF